jgi:hypothetical protein
MGHTKLPFLSKRPKAHTHSLAYAIVHLPTQFLTFTTTNLANL